MSDDTKGMQEQLWLKKSIHCALSGKHGKFLRKKYLSEIVKDDRGEGISKKGTEIVNSSGEWIWQYYEC